MTNAAALFARGEALSAFAGSGRRIVVAVLLLAVYGVVAYATGCHNGAATEQYATELRRADSAIAGAARLAHVAAVRLDSAKHVVVQRRKEATPVVARADSLRHLVVAIDETTLAVQRTPAAAPLIAIVPPEVVRLRAADSSAIARLEALVIADSIAAVRADERHNADSTQLVAANEKIEVLERRKTPRCGKKCGIAIGVVGTVATVMITDRAKDVARWLARRTRPP